VSCGDANSPASRAFRPWKGSPLAKPPHNTIFAFAGREIRFDAAGGPTLYLKIAPTDKLDHSVWQQSPKSPVRKIVPPAISGSGKNAAAVSSGRNSVEMLLVKLDIRGNDLFPSHHNKA